MDTIGLGVISKCSQREPISITPNAIWGEAMAYHAQHVGDMRSPLLAAERRFAKRLRVSPREKRLRGGCPPSRKGGRILNGGGETMGWEGLFFYFFKEVKFCLVYGLNKTLEILTSRWYMQS